MSVYNVTSRYAAALMQLADEKELVAQISDDIDLVFNTLSGSKDLRSVLKSPVIKEQQKVDILTEVFGTKISKDSLNFLTFVVNKNREDLLYPIVKHFLELRDKKLGLINVQVTSAVDFTTDQIEKLKTKIEAITRKTARFSFKLDEDVIGGFLIRIDDTIFDASVRRQLELLKNKFLSEN